MSLTTKISCSILLWALLCTQLETRVLYIQNYEGTTKSQLPKLQLAKLEAPTRVIYTQPRAVSIARPVKLVSRDLNYVSGGIQLAEDAYTPFVGIKPASVWSRLFGGNSGPQVILLKTAMPETRSIVSPKKTSARCVYCGERSLKREPIEKPSPKHRVNNPDRHYDHVSDDNGKYMKAQKSKSHGSHKDQRPKAVPPTKGAKSENNIKSKPKFVNAKKHERRVRSEEIDEDESDEYRRKPTTKSKAHKERQPKTDPKGEKKRYSREGRLPASAEPPEVPKEMVKKDGRPKTVVPSRNEETDDDDSEEYQKPTAKSKTHKESRPKTDQKGKNKNSSPEETLPASVVKPDQPKTVPANKVDKSEPIKKPVGVKEKPTDKEANDDDDLKDGQENETVDNKVKVYKLKEPIGYEYGYDDILESYEVSDENETDN